LRTVTCLSSDLPNACARPPAHHILPAACLHRQQSGGPCWPSGLLPSHGPVASRHPQPAHVRLPLACTTPTSGHPGVCDSGSGRTQPSSKRRRARLPEAALQTASSATDAKTTSGAVQRSFSQPRSRTVLAAYTSAARPGSADRAGHPGRRHSGGTHKWQQGIRNAGQRCSERAPRATGSVASSVARPSGSAKPAQHSASGTGTVEAVWRTATGAAPHPRRQRCERAVSARASAAGPSARPPAGTSGQALSVPPAARPALQCGAARRLHSRHIAWKQAQLYKQHSGAEGCCALQVASAARPGSRCGWRRRLQSRPAQLRRCTVAAAGASVPAGGGP